MEKWISQMRKGTLELCLLLLLEDDESYGYEIVRKLADQANVDAGESTVYPILARLKVAGYLHQSKRPSQAGPPRNYYSLAERGRSYLSELLVAWDELERGVNAIRAGRSAGGRNV